MNEEPALCPSCHRQVEKLYLVSLEGLSTLLCKECLENPTVMSRLSVTEEDSLDDSQYEDEDLED